MEKERQKIADEERKKNEKQKELIEQNLKNLEERRRLEEEAKLKAKEAQNRRQPVVQEPISREKSPRMENKSKEVFTRQAKYQFSGG